MTYPDNHPEPIEDMFTALRDDPAYTDAELDTGFAAVLADLECLTPERAKKLEALAADAESGSNTHAPGREFLKRPGLGRTAPVPRFAVGPRAPAAPKALPAPASAAYRKAASSGVRRNLVAAGAGALLAATLGTVVTLGATSHTTDPANRAVGGESSISACAKEGCGHWSQPSPSQGSLPLYPMPSPSPSSGTLITVYPIEDATVVQGKRTPKWRIPRDTPVSVDRLSGSYLHIAGSADDWVHMTQLDVGDLTTFLEHVRPQQ